MIAQWHFIRRVIACLGSAVVSLAGGELAFGQVSQPILDGNLHDFSALVDEINATRQRACAVNQLDNILNGALLELCADGFGDEPLTDTATPNLRPMFSPQVLYDRPERQVGIYTDTSGRTGRHRRPHSVEIQEQRRRRGLVLDAVQIKLPKRWQ